MGESIRVLRSCVAGSSVWGGVSGLGPPFGLVVGVVGVHGGEVTEDDVADGVAAGPLDVGYLLDDGALGLALGEHTGRVVASDVGQFCGRSGLSLPRCVHDARAVVDVCPDLLVLHLPDVSTSGGCPRLILVLGDSPLQELDDGHAPILSGPASFTSSVRSYRGCPARLVSTGSMRPRCFHRRIIAAVTSRPVRRVTARAAWAAGRCMTARRSSIDSRACWSSNSVPQVVQRTSGLPGRP